MATVSKRGNTYRITVSCGYDTTGKQIRKTMTYKPEPNMTEKQIEKEVKRQTVLFQERCENGQVSNGRIKLAEFIDTYFADYAKMNLKKKTVIGYKGLVPVVNQALGHLYISKIQPHHLNAFYSNLSEVGARRRVTYKVSVDLKAILKSANVKMTDFCKAANVSEYSFRSACKGNPISEKNAKKICSALGLSISKDFEAIGADEPLSPETVRHYHRFISSVLGVAVKWQLIVSNPCERVTLPKKRKAVPKYLDENEAALLLELVEKEDMQHKTMIKLLMYTGMRREELCGLEWKDIDFVKSVITIARASIYIPNEGVISDTTKNENSVRCIKAPSAAIEMLKDYRVWQTDLRLRMGDRWHNSDRLFTTYEGNPIHPDTITGWFHDFIEKNNLPKVTIHSLRHTNATMLINSQVPVTTVAARLGHANPSTTTKIYAHAIKSADAAAAEALDDIFSRKREEPSEKPDNTIEWELIEKV